MDRFAGAVLLGVIVSVGGIPFAEAACNNIPSADRLSLAPSMPPSLEGSTSGTGLEKFGFKGAFGRVDRVHLLPAPAGKAPSAPDAPAVTVVADGVCVRPDGHPIIVAPAKFDSVDDLVALVYFRSVGGRGSTVRAYGTTKSCSDLTAAANASRGKKGVAVQVMRTCSMDGVKSVTIEKGADGLRIPLPDVNVLKRELGPAKASSAVRVVVAPKDRAGALLQTAADQSCSQLCAQFTQGQLAVCIDEIFAASAARNGPPTYSSDPIPCAVQMPTGLDPIDFAEECENEDATPPLCRTNAVRSIKLWQDECGGVHIPFDWKGILPASRKREVSGRSGVGREKSDKDPAVWIPGREFLGSTPINDPQGTSPGVDWRRPKIDVWPDNPDEFGLMGRIDQDDSIVHIFPRLPTKVVCAGTKNACMGIDSDSDPHFVTCACADNGTTPCTCDELDAPRFFVCGSGDKRGMPCTRDRHCPSGRCDGTPHCHPFGSVWKGQPDNQGTECMIDQNCRTTGAAKQQCGYRLFNLEDAIDDPIDFPPAPKWGAIVLDAKLETGGPHKRRGVCKKNGKPCGNGNGPGRCAQDECRGYQLRAGKGL